ncbi:MAG: hypothetical protein LBM87_08475 [Ruminococcus sp.]|jgi:hypothetical protein|nr:hypothetical protein [Ruminococcus sp.]
MNRIIDLSGEWRFCLDPDKCGIDSFYYAGILPGTMKLPGTVSAQNLSDEIAERYADRLTDPHLYEGWAWLQRTVKLPDTHNCSVFLTLERTRKSTVFINGQEIEPNTSLNTPHVINITAFVGDAGEYDFCILLDNTDYPFPGRSLTSPGSQTNWLGILGNINITVHYKTFIDNIVVTPFAESGDVRVAADICGEREELDVTLAVTDDVGYRFPPIKVKTSRGKLTVNYPLGKNFKPWDEFAHKLYELTITVDGEFPDRYNTSFGFRDIKTENGKLCINGEQSFWRGKIDSLVFPLTGAFPTDVLSWVKIFKTAKLYGINLYKFKACCPPEAAFFAADTIGMYLVPEMPFSGHISDELTPENALIIEEGRRILRSFGNHPSFVMLSLGDKIYGGNELLEKVTAEFKSLRPKIIFVSGYNGSRINDDFFVGTDFGEGRYIKGSFAAFENRAGFIQTDPPCSDYNYDKAISPFGADEFDVKPVISNEIGQYAMYPDYSEIQKFTGVLKPSNLEQFKARLESAGMADRAKKYFECSGRFAVSLYKAEIETALRSENLSGFNLFDLQDYHGGGTSTVGILNAFTENKGIITDAAWRQFCSEFVVLGVFRKFVFVSEERFNMGVKIANFSGKTIPIDKTVLHIHKGNESILSYEDITYKTAECGRKDIANFEIKLPFFDEAKLLRIDIEVYSQKQIFTNSYEIYVYPEKRAHAVSKIVITRHLGEAVEHLERGEKVLFFPSKFPPEKFIRGEYCTDIRNFKYGIGSSPKPDKPIPTGTLGLCIDDSHPIFKKFPTKSFTAPQWYDIITASGSIVLDGIDIEPIVSMIDNPYRSHNLGMIFEAKALNGKLLVSMCPLDRIESIPAHSLLSAIKDYMDSKDFFPEIEIEEKKLRLLFMK